MRRYQRSPGGNAAARRHTRNGWSHVDRRADGGGRSDNNVRHRLTGVTSGHLIAAEREHPRYCYPVSPATRGVYRTSGLGRSECSAMISRGTISHTRGSVMVCGVGRRRLGRSLVERQNRADPGRLCLRDEIRLGEIKPI